MALPNTAPTYQFLDALFADGTILGQTSSSNVGFFGSVTNHRPTNLTTVDNTASTSTSSAFGYTTSTQADAVVTAINGIIARLIALGLMAAS
jgi:hypothetical protein